MKDYWSKRKGKPLMELSNMGNTKHVNGKHGFFYQFSFFFLIFDDVFIRNLENVLSLCMHSCLSIKSRKLCEHLNALIIDVVNA